MTVAYDGKLTVRGVMTNQLLFLLSIDFALIPLTD